MSKPQAHSLLEETLGYSPSAGTLRRALNGKASPEEKTHVHPAGSAPLSPARGRRQFIRDKFVP